MSDLLLDEHGDLAIATASGDLALADERLALRQDVLHRALATPGTVPGAPDMGGGLASLWMSTPSDGELRAAQTAIQQDIARDDRLIPASVVVSLQSRDNAVSIAIRFTATNGREEFLVT